MNSQPSDPQSPAASEPATSEHRPIDYITTCSPPVPDVRFDLQILQSLRRIIRAADLFSHSLAKLHKVTSPQLMCLHKLLESDGMTVSGLSRAIYLSPSTTVGILDRLERHGLITRVRSSVDRRKVLIHVTQAGRDLVNDAPSPLQRALENGLGELPPEQQATIAESLGSIVQMLELQDLDAAPVLETGALDDTRYFSRDYYANESEAHQSEEPV